jgi:hypothetical protein
MRERGRSSRAPRARAEAAALAKLRLVQVLPYGSKLELSAE